MRENQEGERESSHQSIGKLSFKKENIGMGPLSIFPVFSEKHRIEISSLDSDAACDTFSLQ